MKFFLKICLLYSTSVFAATPIQIMKVFHHTGELGDKLVFYFDKEPVCNYVPDKKQEFSKNGWLVQNYFIPGASIAQEAKAMVKSIADISNEQTYRIDIQSVTQPVSGVKISLYINPKKVCIEYAQSSSISMANGLIFYFHHKDVLNSIQQGTGKILEYVHATEQKNRKVVLDFGHGGEDLGAQGCGIILEKDITLKIGRKVFRSLKKKGYQVILTRSDDIFVPLDQRTKITNQAYPDLLVSIHANSSANNQVNGIETYWTARSKISRQSVTLLNKIINNRVNLINDNVDKSSSLLAQAIHKHTISYAEKIYPVKDRTVKESFAQVLFGTDCYPAALIEIGFLTNLQEAHHLRNERYQSALASGIVNGIEMFFTKKSS